jgi:CheY-like chemotaxis protein
VWAESPAPGFEDWRTEGGPGSVFRFTVRMGLVAGDTRAPELAIAEPKVVVGPVRAAALPRVVAGGPRILLAEDNPVNQKVALHMLRRRGYDVTVAATGREAVDLTLQTTFDLVLMDVQMPEMDGFAATVAIRRAESQTSDRLRIIAMTAHSMAGDRERCLAAGMDGYLSKPIRSADLYALLDHELALRDGPDTDGIAESAQGAA